MTVILKRAIFYAEKVNLIVIFNRAIFYADLHVALVFMLELESVEYTFHFKAMLIPPTL